MFTNPEVVKVLTYGSGQWEGSGQEGPPGEFCGSGASSVPAVRKTESLGVTPSLAQRLVPLPVIYVALRIQTVWTLQNSALL